MHLKLEELLSKLGNPGKFQIFVFLLLCLNYFPLVFNHVIMAFFGARFGHQCHSAAYYKSTEDFAIPQWEGNSTEALEEVQSFSLGKCEASYALSSGRNFSVICPDDEDSVVVFTKIQEEANIITEWNLVCSQAYLSALATTIYFCGVMLGGLVFGHFADKFGRKPTMLFCLFTPMLVGVGTSFATSYWMFVALRFIQGILMQGLQTSTYTLAMELFLPKHRSYAGAILECFWGLSVMTVPALAYFIPNWRHLQLVISLPSLLALCYICLIPESLRWLIMVNKTEEAENLITRVTRFNRLLFPTQAWAEVKFQLGLRSEEGIQHTLVDLLKTPQLRKRSLIMFYIWFCVSIGYYGLTWTITGLPGNKYLNFFIAGVVEFVAYTMVIYITKRFGRKKPLLVYFTLASIFCTSAGVVLMSQFDLGFDKSYLTSGLAIAGKFAMGGLFSVIFLYTVELYPTIIRNIGMGSCAFWTRVGGVIAPQLLFLDKFGSKGLPLILFGVVVLIGGLLTILLPETLGRKLPDTIEDAEKFGYHDNSDGETGEEMKRLDNKDGEQDKMV